MKRKAFQITVTVLMLLAFVLVSQGFSATRRPNRPDANPGNPVTPTDFPAKFLLGIEKPGVIPEKKYFITFSNGDMNDLWRLTFVRDVENFANRYMEEFGIKFMWTNAGHNSAKQLADIESLLALKPDLLLMSANEREPLNVVKEMCDEQGVPLIILDRGIVYQPTDDPNDMYIQSQSLDFFLNGIAMGVAVVRFLTEKYGEPKGNVVELAGILGSEPGIQRSQGVKFVLKNYPNIHMIATRPAEFDRKMGYEAMRDLLETYPKGQIDCVVCGCDETGLGALQAIKEAKRDELIGALISTDAIVEYLEAIDKGEAYMTVECTPYFGLTAFEYGIRYLNGEDIPPRIMLPQRVYIRDGDPKKAELLKAHIKYCRDNNLNFVPVALGGQDVLWLPELDELYPKPWYEDPSVFEGLEPFTTY